MSIGPMLLCVDLTERPDGGLHLRLGLDPPIEGQLSAEQTAKAWEAAELLPRVAPALINSPFQLGRWAKAEERAGVALGSALSAAGGVMSALLAAIFSAEAEDRRPVVLLSLPTPRLRALPWELLCLGDPPVRVSLRAALIRRAPAARGNTFTGPQLRHLLYLPEPEDAAMGAIHEGLRAAAEAEPGVSLVPLTLGAWPPSEAPCLDVLHVAAHGHREQGELHVQVAPGHLIPVLSFTESLAVAARRAALVLLWSCHGAGWDDEALETLAGRLIALGAPVVVAPAVEIPTSWPGPWLSAFQASLVRRASLLEAVGQGRAALAHHQRAHWLFRTHHLRIFASDDGVRGDVLMGWLPEGWPAVAPDLARLLTAAWELARERNSGFVGLEHLLGAIVRDAITQGPLGALLVAALGEHVERLTTGLTRWSATPDVRDPGATPRLLSWGLQLGHGADAEQLWALAAETAAATAAQHSGDPHATVRTLYELTRTKGVQIPATSPLTLSPPLRLEVVGGPEDGRVLAPNAGEIIGRDDPTGQCQPQIALYATTRVVDRTLSRHHLLWLGPGRVRLLRKGDALVRQGVRLPLREGERSLVVGDLLQLSDGTALRALR